MKLVLYKNGRLMILQKMERNQNSLILLTLNYIGLQIAIFQLMDLLINHAFMGIAYQDRGEFT